LAERRRELVCRAGGHRRERSETFLASCETSRLGELSLALGERCGDAQQEVHDERGSDTERDPLAVRVAVLGDRERLMREQQDAEPDERETDEDPGPAATDEHGRERDLHEIEKREWILGTAGQIEQARQDPDVDHHQERDVPLMNGPGRHDAAPAIAEEVHLDREIREQTEADHAEQPRDR
jgi:hypothetical protein